jgi:hypothetical protein
MMMEVGTLVKEKEGPRFGGLVIESKKEEGRRGPYYNVKIQWSDGRLSQYKSTFLEEIVP